MKIVMLHALPWNNATMICSTKERSYSTMHLSLTKM